MPSGSPSAHSTSTNRRTSAAIVRAAQAEAAPVLVGISHSEPAVIAVASLGSLVDNYRAQHAVTMEISIDHSPSAPSAAVARCAPRTERVLLIGATGKVAHTSPTREE